MLNDNDNNNNKKNFSLFSEMNKKKKLISLIL